MIGALIFAVALVVFVVLEVRAIRRIEEEQRKRALVGWLAFSGAYFEVAVKVAAEFERVGRQLAEAFQTIGHTMQNFVDAFDRAAPSWRALAEALERAEAEESAVTEP